MAALTRLISEWKATLSADSKDISSSPSSPSSPTNSPSFRDLFRDRLHKDPYQLRYSLDKKRPDLFMIHPTEGSDKSNEIVAECNGIILNMNTYDVISYGMQTLSDVNDVAYLDNMNLQDNQNLKIEESEDGTVLKVFYWNEEWIVSTNRRIDASRVRWSSSKTFYEMLCEAIPDKDILGAFEKDLDKSKTYSFILLHPENRLVISHPKPQIVYIGHRDNTTFVECFPKSALSWATLPNELSLHEISKVSISEDDVKNEETSEKSIDMKMLKERLTLVRPYSKRGIIISDWSNEKAVSRVKMDYMWFKKANGLRKNMPSLHLSYLACTFEEKKMMKTYFGQLPIFNNIDNLLRYLAKYSFETYRDSYVRKQYKVPADHPIYYVVRHLHYLYKSAGEPIKMQHVRNVLDGTPCYILDSMLHFFSTYGFYPPAVPLPQDSTLPTPDSILSTLNSKRIDDAEDGSIASDVATSGSI